MEGPLVAALRRGAVASLAVRLTSVGVMFLLQLTLARVLSAEEFGLYSYASSVLPILAIFAGAGLPLVAPRFIPQYLADQRSDLLRGFVSFCLRAVVGVNVIFGLAAATLYAVGPDLVDASHRILILQVAGLMFPLTLLQFLQQALRGFRHIAASQIGEQLVVPGGVLLLLLCLPADPPITASSVLTAQCVLLVLCVCLAHWWLSRLAPQASSGKAFQSREWIRSAIPLAMASSAWVLFARTDVLIIGPILGAESVALYSIPVKLTSMLYIGLTSLDAIFSPMAAEAYRQEEWPRLQRLTSLVGRWAFLGTLPLFLVFYFGDTYVLSVFGEEYVASAPVLRILLLGQFATVLAGPVDSLLTMTGQQRAYLRTLLQCMAVGAIVLPASAYWSGLVGVAWSSTAVWILWKASLAWLVWRRLGIRPWVKWNSVRSVNSSH